MVLIRCRRRHGQKVTVLSKRKKYTFYDRLDDQGEMAHSRTSSETENNVDLSGSGRTRLVDEPQSSLQTEGSDPTSSVSSLYMHKKIKKHEEWSNIIGSLISIDLSSNAPQTDKCRKCSQPMEEIFRCRDCGPSGYFCSSCLDEQHAYPHLHIFERFMNGTFITICRETPTWRRIDDHSCDNIFTKSLVIIDGQGRQHVRDIEFCDCETQAETLVRLKLWPASTQNPQVCFQFDLLEWMTALVTECHLSIENFCNAVQVRFSKHDSQLTSMQIKNIYKFLMSDTATWFRHFQCKTR